MSVCRWIISKRYDPMRLCYGWWAASYREQSEKQLGALHDVRATPVFYTVCTTLASTRDRQPLGSSPNHAHATEDNTPCWGESAVATRVLTQWLYLGCNYACTLPPTGEQRVRVRRPPRVTTESLHHGVGTTIPTRGGCRTPGWHHDSDSRRGWHHDSDSRTGPTTAR